MFSLLIDHGASIFEEGCYGAGNSLLLMCCEMEDLDLLNSILSHNIRVDTHHDARVIARALLVSVKHCRADFIEALSPLVREVYEMDTELQELSTLNTPCTLRSRWAKKRLSTVLRISVKTTMSAKPS